MTADTVRRVALQAAAREIGESPELRRVTEIAAALGETDWNQGFLLLDRLNDLRIAIAEYDLARLGVRYTADERS